MADIVTLHWEPTHGQGLPGRDRRGGKYRSYRPDPLAEAALTVAPDLAIRAAQAERAIRALTESPDAADLAGVSRLLLRSEAIASSLIEGIAPSPQQVALAELAGSESVRGFTADAQLVANNIAVLRTATHDLAVTDLVTVPDLESLHRQLLPDEQHHGLRTVPNWIGGSDRNPLDADFVPPPPADVPGLMTDLVTYVNGAAHAPLIQAAIVHAQFETIHPFTDGNGRVGRALIHTVLARRGLSPRAILPISSVLATLSGSYVEGLTAYRHGSPAGSPTATAGVGQWLSTFVDAAATAIEQAQQLLRELVLVREAWNRQVQAHRESVGIRQSPRAGSATARILEILPDVPVMTTRTIERLLGVSFPSARAGLEELAEAGVLSRKSVDRGTTGYLATDVLSLIAHTERRLASTRFDTRRSAPGRPVASPPPR